MEVPGRFRDGCSGVDEWLSGLLKGTQFWSGCLDIWGAAGLDGWVLGGPARLLWTTWLDRSGRGLADGVGAHLAWVGETLVDLDFLPGWLRGGRCVSKRNGCCLGWNLDVGAGAGATGQVTCR